MDRKGKLLETHEKIKIKIKTAYGEEKTRIGTSDIQVKMKYRKPPREKYKKWLASVSLQYLINLIK
jgi:hypothetical protein